MCDNSTEEKIKTLFGNAVTVSKCIQENKDKNIRSLSEDVLTRYFDPSERKNTIRSFFAQTVNIMF
jgi:hypothetical protein